jgi:hypothetical protein
MAGVERRKGERVDVWWPVRVWVDRQPLAGRAVNASPLGLSVVVSGPPPLEVGKVYEVDVFSDTTTPVRYAATVVRVTDDGAGLQRTELEPLE